MKQNRYNYILTFLLFLFVLPLCKAQNIKFIEGDFEHIIQKAKTVRKPFIAYFTFKGCKECKEMERKSFKDKSVKKYIKSYYLAAEIDMNDIESASWQKHFEIESFPTIIIFDHEGIVLEKYDNPLSNQDLLQELRKNYYVFQNLNKPKNQKAAPIIVNNSVPDGPEIVCMAKKDVLRRSLLSVSVSTDEEVESAITEALFQQPIAITVAKSKDQTVSLEGGVPVLPIANAVSINKTPITKVVAPVAATKSVVDNIKLPKTEEIDFKENIVEVGTYKNYKESLEVLKKIRKQSDYSIYVLPEAQNGVMVYKILVGDLPNERAAASFLNLLSAL